MHTHARNFRKFLEFKKILENLEKFLEFYCKKLFNDEILITQCVPW